jgi:hypothetical protein
MEPFFTEPDNNGQPPEKIRFEKTHIEPYQGTNRIKLQIEITPFLEKPNIEIEIFSKDGNLISSMSIVEIIEHKFELTLHLRDENPKGEYLLKTNIYYSDLSHYEIKEEEEQVSEGKADINIVDEQEKLFNIQVEK